MIDGLASQMVEGAQARSWEPQTTVDYRVSRPNRNRRLNMVTTFPMQDERTPHGITESEAMDLAGRDGVVYRVTTTRERIK